MTWAKLDDQTARKPAVRAAGLHGRALWRTSVTEVAAAYTDGLVSALLVKDCLYLAECKPKVAIAACVESGLWHDHETVRVCGPCWDRGGNRVAPGEYFLHEWWELLLLSEGKDNPLARWRERRRKALNNMSDLVAEIRLRDQDRCRYCGAATIDSSGPDKKSGAVRTLDHVDPFCKDGSKGYGNTLDNVVVACKTCNGRKKDRTPDEARMPLLEPGQTARTRPDNPAGRPEMNPQDRAGNPAGPRVTREAGTGRIGSGRNGATAGSTAGSDRSPAPSNGHQPEGGGRE